MMTAGTVGLLSREQPPVALLPTIGELELHLAGGERLDRVVGEWRFGTPQAGDQLGIDRKSLEHTAERFPRPAPDDDLVVDEPDRVALAEASSCVVASSGRDRARADPFERLD